MNKQELRDMMIGAVKVGMSMGSDIDALEREPEYDPDLEMAQEHLARLNEYRTTVTFGVNTEGQAEVFRKILRKKSVRALLLDADVDPDVVINHINDEFPEGE